MPSNKDLLKTSSRPVNTIAVHKATNEIQRILKKFNREDQKDAIIKVIMFNGFGDILA